MASNRLPPLGVGTWAWGDRGLWGFGRAYGEQEIAEAFQASLSSGVTLFDTAEVYGGGLSERLLGKLAKDQPVTIATKFFPRLMASSVTTALQASLERLQRGCVDLYQVHWPAPWLSNTRLMALLAQAVHSGRARAIGVSNYSEKQMRRAHRALASHGVPLVSNQVEYSLLRRKPEINGVADACHELGVTLIAYSPLAMGALSGKYSADRPPSGARQLMRAFRLGNLRRAERLLHLLRDLAKAKAATSSQVALRWLMDRGALPIPGAKNAAQAKENAGALHISLTPGERDELDRVSMPWR